ncbi:hypothetical protein LFL97_20835 [Burkholderia sp. JSH-S8]|nr:hypothetical protein LFL97_20835 [Burkholderia sp. JSH-S8]
MHFDWIQNTGHSNVCDGIPDEDFPVMVLWYGGMQSQLVGGKTRRVQVAFQRLDTDEEPFFSDVAFSHLHVLRLGSVWQRRRHVGDARLAILEPTLADFSAGSWSIMSAKTEAAQGRPAPLNGKYRVYHEDERQEQSWLLEFELPDGRTLIVPCMEFLLRSYGASELIPRALTSLTWEESLSLFLTSTLPEKNADGAWVVRLADRMQDGDVAFLGHIQHVSSSRSAAQGIVQQCAEQAKNRKWILPKVEPWFSGKVHVSATGIWLRKQTFLALRFELNGEPDGPEISAVKTRKEDVLRTEREHIDDVAREGSPHFTLSPESQMSVRSLDNFDTTGIAPPATVGMKRKLLLGPRRKITTTYEQKPSIVIPPQTAGEPGVRLDPSTIQDITEAHRMVVAHGTLLEMWKELCRLKTEHPSILHSVEWLHVKRGFVDDETPELVALQPFADAEPATPDARKFVTRDIKTEPPRGVLVLRLRAKDPDSPAWKVFYVLEIERRRQRTRIGGTVVQTEGKGCRGLVAILSPETQFREWLLKVLSDIRHVVGKVVKLETTRPDELVAFKHRPSEKKNMAPLRTSALLALKKAGVAL